jgi:hypothetical protein
MARAFGKHKRSITPPASAEGITDTSLSTAQEEEVRALLARGSTKPALELAKQMHKRFCTQASEALLVDAYAARVRSLLEAGLTDEAQALLKLARERYASAKEKLADIAAGVAVPHRPRADAAGRRKTFESTTNAPLEDEVLRPPQISRRGPLALWGVVYHRRAGYVLALVAGLAFTVWLVPRHVLFPANYYDQAVSGDTAQHITGQRYFILDEWRWPLLQVKLLRWPKGTNIALTDSIPLLAIPAKLLRRFLPPGFHALFWFLAIAWCLQPVAAVFALRSAGEKRLLPSLATAVIALSMPTLLYRTAGGHQALCGHFLILVAIGLYFRISHGSRIAAWLGPPLLLVPSLLIHPYLMAMIAAVFLAAPLSLLIRRNALFLPALVSLVVGVAISGGLALLLGYNEEVGNARGYGWFSMNLLSPIYPAKSTLIPFFPKLMDATGGQYEGYQYLGVGVLLLCLTAVISIGYSGLKRVCARHSGLLMVCAGIILFSLSNDVYCGKSLVFHFQRVPQIFTWFRASGRFFWPVTYLLLIGSIAIVTRRLPAKVSAIILLIAAGLQFADATALRNGVHNPATWTQTWKIDHDALAKLMQHSDRLTVWPPSECRPSVIGDPQYTQVLLLASQYGLRTNSMYTPSPRPIGSCRADDVIGTPLQAGELRIILPTRTPTVPPPDWQELCQRIGNVIACASAL